MAEKETAATDLLASLSERGKLCTPDTGKISIPTDDLVETILKLAGAMAEILLYDYQKDFARRVIQSILLRDAAMITAEFSRQSGKTSTVACVCLACMVILPALALQFPEDWRFNLTDEEGRYRGFKHGVNFGIYAPILDQAQTTFERLRMYVSTPTAMSVLDDLGMKATVNRGDCLSLSNGSSAIAKSASKGSNIEGKTHHVLILEEAQDIDTMKVRKSLHPMVAATKGTIIKIGTASIRKCDFYLAIQQNKRREAVTGRRDHYRYDYETCQKSNSLYRDYVKEEKARLGEQSDEFRMAYKLEWILERGMFLTTGMLMSRNVAKVEGVHSRLYTSGYRGMHLVAGIDLGKESDSTVVTIVEAEWDNPALYEIVNRDMMDTEFTAYNKHLLAWMELQGDDYEYQYGEVVNFLRKFRGLQKVVLDATREASFHDRLSHQPGFEDVEFEDFIFSTATKAAGFRSFQGDILSGRLTFPAGVEARISPLYRKFVTQMLDLTKTYSGEFLCVAAPDEKGAHDDFPCFPAGTPVLTECGELPIEQVSVGTRVMSSTGWQRVLAARHTGFRPLVRKGNLIGTAEHPFYCADKRMYVPLDALVLGDTLLACKKKPLSLTGSSFTVTLPPRVASIVSTFGRTIAGSKRLSRYIATYGKNGMARFLRDTSCIIETAMAQTTLPAISGCCLAGSTSGGTPLPPSAARLLAEVCQSRKPLRRLPGTPTARRPSFGSAADNDLSPSGSVVLSARSSARSAVRSTRPDTSESHQLVPISVRHAVGSEHILRRYASTLRTGEHVPVYNLEVAGSADYICQGVLVHNCSAMLAAWGANTPAKTLQVQGFSGSMLT